MFWTCGAVVMMLCGEGQLRLAQRSGAKGTRTVHPTLGCGPSMLRLVYRPMDPLSSAATADPLKLPGEPFLGGPELNTDSAVASGVPQRS